MKRLLALTIWTLAATSAFAAEGSEQLSPICQPWPFAGGGSISFSNFTLNSSAGTVDRVAYCFQAETNASVTHLGFRYGLRTGTPPTYKICLQSKSATAVGPDGTCLNTATNFTPPASTAWDGTWQWIDTTDYSPSRGQFVCTVIEYQSGTIDVSNNSSFTTSLTNAGYRTPFPNFWTQTDAGTWSGSSEELPVYGYKTATRTFGYPIEDFVTSEQYSSDSTPDERGLRFKLPSTAFSTYQVIGAQVMFAAVPATGKTVNMKLYTGTNTTATQSVAIDTDYITAQTGSVRTPATFLFSDSTLATLSAGTVNRLTFEAGSTTTNIALGSLLTDSNAEMAAFPCGLEAYTSTRTDAGSWDSDNTLKRPLIYPIIKEVTAPAGGGIMRTPGLNGGIN